MTDTLYIVLAATAAAFLVLGGLYRLTPSDVWPVWLRPLGAGAWYVVAAIGGVFLAAQIGSWGEDEKADTDGEGLTPEPSTVADEADEETADEQEAQENPSAQELAEQLDKLGGDE